jgi:hypothetical protein
MERMRYRSFIRQDSNPRRNLSDRSLHILVLRPRQMMLKNLSFLKLPMTLGKNQRSTVAKSLIPFDKRWDSSDLSFVISDISDLKFENLRFQI